ncbi:MAG: glycosyltransferase, partial [Hymenobacter sp.]
MPDSVSIILPTYNEAASIGDLLRYLQATAGEPAPELLVVDGGSTDATVAQARQAGATVLRSPRKGRAAQLNYGAQQAQGTILYFLHADSYPPPGFLADLRQAVAQVGEEMGRRVGVGVEKVKYLALGLLSAVVE